MKRRLAQPDLKPGVLEKWNSLKGCQRAACRPTRMAYVLCKVLGVQVASLQFRCVG